MTSPVTAATGHINNLLHAVTKLKDDNYPDWKFDVVMVMRTAGGDLYNVVTGKISRPEDPKDPSNADLIKNQGIWDTLLGEGIAIIGLTIDPTQKEFIRESTTAFEAWDALKEMYEKDSTSKRTALKRKFYSYQHDTSKPISTYISEITSAANALKAIGIQLTSIDITHVLIYSLLAEYSNVATVLMTRSSWNRLTVTDVSAALREKEARINATGSGTTEPASLAFMAHSNCRGPSGSSAKCSTCGKTGHTAKRCWSSIRAE